METSSNSTQEPSISNLGKKSFFDILQLISQKDNIELLDKEQYGSIIKFYAENRINAKIGNDNKDKAAIIFKYLFSKATSNINIYTEKLSGEVADNPVVLEALDIALKKNVLITIIVDNKPHNSTFANRIIESKSKNVKLFIKNKNSKTNYGFFATADKIAYREQEGRVNEIAECNFYGIEKTQKLDNNFIDLLNNSNPYTPKIKASTNI